MVCWECVAVCQSVCRSATVLSVVLQRSHTRESTQENQHCHWWWIEAAANVATLGTAPLPGCQLWDDTPRGREAAAAALNYTQPVPTAIDIWPIKCEGGKGEKESSQWAMEQCPAPPLISLVSPLGANQSLLNLSSAVEQCKGLTSVRQSGQVLLCQPVSHLPYCHQSSSDPDRLKTATSRYSSSCSTAEMTQERWKKVQMR